MDYLYVFAGGGIGSMTRFFITKISARIYPDFPWGTLSANILGTFLIGVFSIFILEKGKAWAGFPFARELVMVGFLGGLTTFSTFMLDFYNLSHSHEWLKLFLYFTGNTVLGFAVLITGKYMAG